MAERIYRYEVPVDGRWHDITMAGAGTLRVGCRNVHVVEFWTTHDDVSVEEVRRFRVVGTGEPMPDGARWWGTAVAPGGRLVWHLVEAAP